MSLFDEIGRCAVTGAALGYDRSANQVSLGDKIGEKYEQNRPTCSSKSIAFTIPGGHSGRLWAEV